MKIKKGEKFIKEFKRLQKKYRSLVQDFDFLSDVILDSPTGNGTKHWNILKQDGEKYMLKVRMMCRAVKGSSFRVVYYYDGENIELVFIEIYFKGKKESENKERIDSFWEDKTRDNL